MITSETQVRAFQKSQPLPSFRLNAPKTNPFVPSLPASVTGLGSNLEFTWTTEAGIRQGETAGQQPEPLLTLVEKLRRDAARFPESAMVRINLARALANQGRLDEAEKELVAAMELDPISYLARISLAHLLTQSSRFDEATRLYDELLAERPSDNTALVSLAVMALRRNEYDEAADKLRLASANRESDPTIHFLLGIVRLRMNDFSGAVAELRQASHMDVRNPAIHQALGVIFALRSEFDRAEQEFRAALSLTPNDRASVRSLYQVLLKQSKTDEAVDLLKSFVEQNPRDLGAREALALGLLDLRRFNIARFHLMKIVGEGTGLPVAQVARIHANIGLAWLLEGKVDNARATLRKAIDIYPEVSPIAYENLARLYLGQDNIEAAKEVLLESERIFPDRAPTIILLSHSRAVLGDVVGAIKGLERFRNRVDAPSEVYVHLSFYYSLNEDLDASVNLAREGLRKFPHSPGLLNNLAYFYAMSDKLEEARLALRTVPKDTAPTVELLATRGLVRLREGDERLGVELYGAAERLATEIGNKQLGRRVRQKRHLELARFLMRKRMFNRARSEVKLGLAVRVGHYSYDHELLSLSEDLKGTPDAGVPPIEG